MRDDRRALKREGAQSRSQLIRRTGKIAVIGSVTFAAEKLGARHEVHLMKMCAPVVEMQFGNPTSRWRSAMSRPSHRADGRRRPPPTINADVGVTHQWREAQSTRDYVIAPAGGAEGSWDLLFPPRPAGVDFATVWLVQ